MDNTSPCHFVPQPFKCNLVVPPTDSESVSMKPDRGFRMREYRGSLMVPLTLTTDRRIEWVFAGSLPVWTIVDISPLKRHYNLLHCWISMTKPTTFIIAGIPCIGHFLYCLTHVYRNAFIRNRTAKQKCSDMGMKTLSRPITSRVSRNFCLDILISIPSVLFTK